MALESQNITLAFQVQNSMAKKKKKIVWLMPQFIQFSRTSPGKLVYGIFVCSLFPLPETEFLKDGRKTISCSNIMNFS